MHRSKNPLALALLCLLNCLSCGVMFNGVQQAVEIKTADPNARIFADGTLLGTGSATLHGSPSAPPVVFIEGADGNGVRFVPESKVSVAAVVLDVLWCFTIIGVAAPAADALMGTFSGLQEPSGPIVVPPRVPRQRDVQYAAGVFEVNTAPAEAEHAVPSADGSMVATEPATAPAVPAPAVPAPAVPAPAP